MTAAAEPLDPEAIEWSPSSLHGVLDDALSEGGSAVYAYEDEDGYAEEDDEELFSALDEALDEIEAEARAEAILAVARPEHDHAEPIPGPTAQYRAHLGAFLGGRSPVRAPRYGEARADEPEDEVLRRILMRGLHRARRSFDERKAVGRITNPKQRARLTY